MNLEEHTGKALLAVAGLAIPKGKVCTTPMEAAYAAAELGHVVIKAQVLTGKRGKAGGIRFADGIAAASQAASALLGSTIAGHRVDRVLVEERLDIRRELFLAVLADPASNGPMILLSADGGMDVEAAFCGNPTAMRQTQVDIIHGPTEANIQALTNGLGHDGLDDVIRKVYDVWRNHDLESLEINPLAVLADGRLVAADCKAITDDSAKSRHPDLPVSTPTGTKLELRARVAGLQFIELDGEVGVLANGAGLTMTTLDMVAHYGGLPANFLEIGGDAYTKARIALELVLANPRVKSLVVNFCGAYARTDVMAAGVAEAWIDLAPSLPAFFSVHGTGEDEAVALLRDRLGVTPFDLMEDAIQAAVEAAR